MTQHTMTNASDIKRYTLAGHAKLTLTSQRTGQRYTFQINQAKDRDTGERKSLWFVALLTGSNNDTDYQYVGIIDDNGFRRTAKSRFTDDSLPVKGFQYFWKHVCDNHLPPHLDTRHSGHCGRCGRTLTVPSSIDSGIGPECARIMGI